MINNMKLRLNRSFANACYFAVVCAIAFTIHVPTMAQDPFGDNPFGDAGGPALSGSADDVSDEDKDDQPAAADDAVILAIRDSNPTTPTELIDAAIAMLDYQVPREALAYLRKLLESKPEQDAWVAAYRKHGSGTFLRLRRAKELQPEGGQVADAASAAMTNFASDPQRVAELVNRLSNGSDDASALASIELQSVPIEASINPLLKVLGNANRKQEHFRVQLVLEELGEQVVEPLLGALESSNASMQARVIEVLGDLGVDRAMPQYVAAYANPKSEASVRAAAEQAISQFVKSTPTAWEAERYLYQQARRSFEDSAPTDPLLAEHDKTYWTWHAQRQEVTAASLSLANAKRNKIVRITRQLIALAPTKPDYRRLHLAALLEQEKGTVGYQDPLSDGSGSATEYAKKIGPEFAETTLHYCLKHDRIAAAIGAIELLGTVGDKALLESPNGYPRPLAAALMHDDRYVRFAAMKAIAAIDPKRSYPGSSRFVEAIAFFLKSGGERRAIVGYPSRQEAQTAVGLLAVLGIEGVPATTGHSVLRRATQSADYEFVLLRDELYDPPLDETIQLLRNNPTMRRIPIGIMARGEAQYLRMRDMANRFPLVKAFPRAHTVEAMAWELHQLTLTDVRRDQSQPDVRLAHASEALKQLKPLLDARKIYHFYDIHRLESPLLTTFRAPRLVEQAIPLVGKMGTQACQSDLIDYVSQYVNPIELRQAAAKAFDNAVQRRGLLLLPQQVANQYERYNASESASAETQAVLAAILDTIEATHKE